MRHVKLGRTIQVLAAVVLMASAFLLLRAHRVGPAASAQLSPDPEKFAEAYHERLQETKRILQSECFDVGPR
jgi:hypothetical protein